MTFLRSVYVSLIVSGCCVTIAGLSSPSLAGEPDLEVDFSGVMPEPLVNPLLLGLTSGTCLGLMARLKAVKRQCDSLQVQAAAQEQSWNTMLQTSIEPEFSESDLSQLGLDSFLEAELSQPAEDPKFSVSIMA